MVWRRQRHGDRRKRRVSRRWRLQSECEEEGEDLHRGKQKNAYVCNNLQDGINDDAAQVLDEGTVKVNENRKKKAKYTHFKHNYI